MVVLVRYTNTLVLWPKRGAFSCAMYATWCKILCWYICIGVSDQGGRGPPDAQASSGREGSDARHSSNASSWRQIGAEDCNPFESRMPAKIGRPIRTPTAPRIMTAPEMRLSVRLIGVISLVPPYPREVGGRMVGL